MVGEHLVPPLELARERSGVGIDHELRGIEAKALLRDVRTMHAMAIELSRAQPRRVPEEPMRIACVVRPRNRVERESVSRQGGEAGHYAGAPVVKSSSALTLRSPSGLSAPGLALPEADASRQDPWTIRRNAVAAGHGALLLGGVDPGQNRVHLLPRPHWSNGSAMA